MKVIFHKGGGPVTNDRAATDVENGFRYPSMRNRICKSSQRMCWRDFRGGPTSDTQGFRR